RDTADQHRADVVSLDAVGGDGLAGERVGVEGFARKRVVEECVACDYGRNGRSGRPTHAGAERDSLVQLQLEPVPRASSLEQRLEGTTGSVPRRLRGKVVDATHPAMDPDQVDAGPLHSPDHCTVAG